MRLLWLEPAPLSGPTSGPPAVDGLQWEPCASFAQAAERLGAEVGLTAVVLRVTDPAQALRAFESPIDTPMRRRAVLVWPLHDDPTLDEPLYGAGVQDILVGDLPPDQLLRRLRAALLRKRAEAAAQRGYATDPLTGLVNRQQLVEHLSHLLAVRAREPAPIGLVVLQVALSRPEAAPATDPLPTFDDLEAAERAQLVRRKVGVRLRAGVRASDVVAAIDGQTYAVMLSTVDTPADVATVAAKLAASLVQPIPVGGTSVRVSVQVGHAVAPQDGDQPEPLIHRAAMLAAGAAGAGFSGGVAANDP